MAADGQVNIALKITADNAGARKVEQSLDRVGTAAKKTATQSKSGFEQMQQGVGKVQGAFGALRNVLTGFGIGALVGAMTAGIGKIVESFGSAKKNAEDFAAIQNRLAEEKGIARLSTDYAKLTDAINAAAVAQNHQLEMIDIEVATRRKLAAARLEAAKEEELSNLDTNASDYAEQADRIEKKYAALKASRDASNASEDVMLARQKLGAQADQTDAQADAQVAASAAIKAKIAKAQREKGVADVAAASLNENDKTGVGSAVGKTLAQLFSGDWGRMTGAKTAEGDAARKAAAEKSAELEKQIAALTEELRKSNETAAKLRQEATNTREKASAMNAQYEIAAIEGDTARSQAARGEKTAQTALDANHAAQAAEAAKIADAQKAQQLLAQQRAALTAKITAQQQRKDAANYAVYQAQGNYDLSRANGASRSSQSAAFSALQNAQNAAQNVNHAADTAINALTETLKSVEARLKAAQSFLESQSKQQRNAWSESPAGA